MKKRLSIILISVILVMTFAFGAGAYIAGDTDNDFLITAADARFTLRLSVGLEECEKNSDQFFAADADNDGKITAGDARLILRASVGLEKFASNTATHLKVVMTKLPYKTNGLVINSITEDETYYYLNVTNKTNKEGKAVSDYSYIPYKMYNAKGDVIESSSVYMNNMNNNESCTVKIRKEATMAKLLFGAATVKFKDASLKTETQKVDGITISKPFTYNGFQVTKLTLDKENNRLTIVAKNVSGGAQSGYISFKATDANGNALSERTITLVCINPGETTTGYTTLPSGAVSFIAVDVTANTGLEKFTPAASATATTNGITHTKLPVTTAGLKIDLVSLEKGQYSNNYTLRLKITNKTGKTVAGHLTTKEFNAEGHVITRSLHATEILNNGESCFTDISLSREATKILIGNTYVTDEKSPTPGKLTTVNGLKTNIASETFGGLKISELTVNKRTTYTDITFKITNTSQKAIDPNSSLFFKTLSSDKTVLYTTTRSLGKTLNSGEFMYAGITVYSDIAVSDFYVIAESIKNCNPVKDSASYQTVGTLKVTKAPVTFNNLTITSYRLDDSGRLYITVKNNTGVAVKDSSYFDYRIHGKDGSVVKENSVYCNQMNKGETCEIYIYLDDDYGKITFTDSYVRTY